MVGETVIDRTQLLRDFQPHPNDGVWGDLVNEAHKNGHGMIVPNKVEGTEWLPVAADMIESGEFVLHPDDGLLPQERDLVETFLSQKPLRMAAGVPATIGEAKEYFSSLVCKFGIGSVAVSAALGGRAGELLSPSDYSDFVIFADQLRNGRQNNVNGGVGIPAAGSRRTVSTPAFAENARYIMPHVSVDQQNLSQHAHSRGRARSLMPGFEGGQEKGRTGGHGTPKDDDVVVLERGGVGVHDSELGTTAETISTDLANRTDAEKEFDRMAHPDSISLFDSYLARARSYIDKYDKHDMPNPEERENEAYAMAHGMHVRDHSHGLSLATRIGNLRHRRRGDFDKIKLNKKPAWYGDYVKVWEEARLRAIASRRALNTAHAEQGSSDDAEAAVTPVADDENEWGVMPTPKQQPTIESLPTRTKVWLGTAYSRKADDLIRSEFKAGFFNQAGIYNDEFQEKRELNQSRSSRAYMLGKWVFRNLDRLGWVQGEEASSSTEPDKIRGLR